MYIVISICSSNLSQHALGDCTIKFESNSFRILLSAGHSSFEPFDAVEDAVSSQQSAVCSLPSKSKVRRHQTPANFHELASPLHYGAYATGGTENTGLLTEQALPLSEESLFRQQAFASSCGIALAAWLLLC